MHPGLVGYRVGDGNFVSAMSASVWECTGILLGWTLFSQHPQNCPLAEDRECPISGWTLFSTEDRLVLFCLGPERRGL